MGNTEKVTLRWRMPSEAQLALIASGNERWWSSLTRTWCTEMSDEAFFSLATLKLSASERTLLARLATTPERCDAIVSSEKRESVIVAALEAGHASPETLLRLATGKVKTVKLARALLGQSSIRDDVNLSPDVEWGLLNIANLPGRIGKFLVDSDLTQQQVQEKLTGISLDARSKRDKAAFHVLLDKYPGLLNFFASKDAPADLLGVATGSHLLTDENLQLDIASRPITSPGHAWALMKLLWNPRSTPATRAKIVETASSTVTSDCEISSVCRKLRVETSWRDGVNALRNIDPGVVPIEDLNGPSLEMFTNRNISFNRELPGEGLALLRNKHLDASTLKAVAVYLLDSAAGEIDYVHQQVLRLAEQLSDNHYVEHALRHAVHVKRRPADSRDDRQNTPPPGIRVEPFRPDLTVASVAGWSQRKFFDVTTVDMSAAQWATFFTLFDTAEDTDLVADLVDAAIFAT